jgi:hypothetical protein
MKFPSASHRGPIIVTAVGLLLFVAQAESARKIRLPPPGKSIDIEGELHGTADRKNFVFQGASGTKVRIKLSGAGPLRGEVTFPSQGKHEGSPGGVILDQLLTESGGYQLEISESSMGESWDGKFKISISVAQ